jgi:hypothetical protein
VAVTVIEKHRQQDVRARILYPAAVPPVMAFGHDMDFAIARRHWFLLLQQVGFTATSLLGIWSWLL